jgi:hypothetical protein
MDQVRYARQLASVTSSLRVERVDDGKRAGVCTACGFEWHILKDETCAFCGQYRPVTDAHGSNDPNDPNAVWCCLPDLTKRGDGISHYDVCEGTPEHPDDMESVTTPTARMVQKMAALKATGT